jgi:hypothetical protein
MSNIRSCNTFFSHILAALRVLESLVAWQDLAAAGLVANASGAAGAHDAELVSTELLKDVKNDIITQLGQPGGTLLTWRSCSEQKGAPSKPSNLATSSCDRDDPDSANQHSYDLGFVPDHALAAKLGVIGTGVLLNMIPAIRNGSVARLGHKLATKSFESNNNSGPLIMVDSEKWKYVDADGYADARADQTGWSQIFRPPRKSYKSTWA